MYSMNHHFSKFPTSLMLPILLIKGAHKSAFFIISTLPCQMAQIYDESVLEISLDNDISSSFVPD